MKFPHYALKYCIQNSGTDVGLRLQLGIAIHNPPTVLSVFLLAEQNRQIDFYCRNVQCIASMYSHYEIVPCVPGGMVLCSRMAHHQGAEVTVTV